MKFYMPLLVLATACAAVKVGEDLEEQYCNWVVDNFESPMDNNVCNPGALPGGWTTCAEACDTEGQALIDELGCCARQYFESIGAADGQAAFDNVVGVCNLDVSDIWGSARQYFESIGAADGQAAFDNVVGVCNLDVSDIWGSCV